MGFKGPKSGAGETQAAKGIRVETSAYGGVVPLVYGETRLAGNIIWIDKFTPHESSQRSGGKEGGRVANTQFTYTCDVIIALCEGVILNGFDFCEIGTAIVGAASQNQADGRTFTPGVWTTKRVKFAGKAQQQSDGGELVKRFAGFNEYTVPDGPYAGAPRIVVPVLSDGAPSAQLQASFGAFAIPPINYFGTVIVAARNLDLGSNASIPQFNFPVRGLCQYYQRYGVPSVGVVTDANPPDIAGDLLTNVKHGIDFRLPTDAPGTSSLIPNWILGANSWGTYTRAADLLISPSYDAQRSMAEVLDELAAMSNSAVVWSDGLLKVIPYADEAVGGGRLGILYDPASTADPFGTSLVNRADLTADDFLREGNDDLVTVTSVPLNEIWNHIRVEYQNRSNAYAVDVQEAKDEAHIAAYGLRSRTPYKYQGVTTAATARLIAQNHLAREMGARSRYRFVVGWRFVLLEAMDLVTITDPSLGLDHQPVRITAISESEAGNLTIEAEEYSGGVGASESYAHQGPEAVATDYDIAPGPIFDMVAFEPLYPLAREPELWLGASGYADRWGGAGVYVSENEDGEYEYVASLGRGVRHGLLIESLPLVASPDTTSSPQLRLFHQQTLESGTTADAEALRRLLYIGWGNQYELVSYSTATLISSGGGFPVYELQGYLVRGAYATVPQAHTTRQRVMRLDESVVRIPLPMRLVGKRLFIKLLPMNVYGSVNEDLDDERNTRHYFDVQGVWWLTPLANVEGLHATLNDGYATLGWSSMVDARGVVGFEVRSGDTWETGTVIGRTPTTSIPVRGVGAYWVAAYLELATGLEVRTLYSETPTAVLIDAATATSDFFREIEMRDDEWVGSTHPYVVAVMARRPQTYLRFSDPGNLARDFAGRGQFESQITSKVRYAGNGQIRHLGGELVGAAYFDATTGPAPGVTLLTDAAASALRYEPVWSVSFRFQRDRTNVVGGECLIDQSQNTVPKSDGTTGWRLCIEQGGAMSIDNGRNQVQLGVSAGGLVNDTNAHTCILTFEAPLVGAPGSSSYPLPYAAALGTGVFAILRVIVDGVEVISILPANMVWPGVSPLFGCRANTTGGSRVGFRGYMSELAWHPYRLEEADGVVLHAAATAAPVGGLVIDRQAGVLRLAGLATFENLVGNVDDFTSIDEAGGLDVAGEFCPDGSVAAQVLSARTTVRPYAELIAIPYVPGELFDNLGGLVDELAPLEGADPSAVTALVEYAPARIPFAESELTAANVRYARQALYEEFRPFLPGLQEAVALRWKLRVQRNLPFVGIECRRLLVGTDALRRTESQQSVAIGAGVERFLASGSLVDSPTALQLALPVEVPAGRSLILAVAYGTSSAAEVVATIAGVPFVELVAAGGATHPKLKDPRASLLQFGVASTLDAGTIIVVDVPAEGSKLLAASLFSVVGVVTADKSATIEDAQATDGVLTVGPTPTLAQALELVVAVFAVRQSGQRNYTPTGPGMEFIQAGTNFSNGAFDVTVCGHVRTTQSTAGVTMAGALEVPMGSAPWYAGVIRTFQATAAVQRMLFARPFNVPPSVQVTVLDMASGDVVKLTNLDTNGFDVQVENTGVAVPRQISWTATGD